MANNNNNNENNSEIENIYEDTGSFSSKVKDATNNLLGEQLRNSGKNCNKTCF